jgi:hypothetical protein
MENLYIVNEYEDYGEYCYIVKADTIDEALSYFMDYKSYKRAEGTFGYEIKNNNGKYIDGVLKYEFGLVLTKFRLFPLEFDASNVVFM